MTYHTYTVHLPLMYTRNNLLQKSILMYKKKKRLHATHYFFLFIIRYNSYNITGKGMVKGIIYYSGSIRLVHVYTYILIKVLTYI